MKKIILIVPLIIFSLVLAQPARAFYLELPQAVRNTINILRSNPSRAQEATNLESSETPPDDPESDVPAIPDNQPMPMPIPSSASSSTSNGGQQMPPAPTCLINGVEQPGPCPTRSPGPMLEPSNRPMPRNVGMDLNRGLNQMESSLRRMETMMNNLSESVRQTARERIERIRSGIAEMRSNPEESSVNMDELQNDLRELEQMRMDIEQVRNMKRMIRDTERGVNNFERQLSRLRTRRIAVPEEISSNIAAAKRIIAAVKSADTREEMEEAGVEDLREIMDNMGENQHQLEMLVRWPDTLRRVNSEITRLNRAVQSSKTMVTRMAARGIDLGSNQTTLEEMVNRLKSTRDEAVQKIASETPEEAFTLLENDFFDQLEDVWQKQKLIQTMNNLRVFSSNFNREISRMRTEIRSLRGRRINVSSLEEILSRTQTKGNEISAAIRAGGNNIDIETILADLDELDALRQDYMQQKADLTGEDEDMPWEQGPRQFTAPTMPANFGRGFESRNTQNSEPQPQPQTLPTGEMQ